MKCNYCNGEIAPGTEVELDGNYFCNTLHRYSWNKGNKNVITAVNSSGKNNQQESFPKIRKPTALQKALFGVFYSVIFYFVLAFVIGGIVGGIAGMEAGNAGRDVAEAGRIAGQQFGAKYGILLLIIAIILSVIGSIKEWLPGTRNRKLSDQSLK